MKLFKSITDINSVILLFCFFLPFIVPMCGEKKAETSAADSTAVDTANYKNLDSAFISEDSLILSVDTLTEAASRVINDSILESKRTYEDNEVWEFIIKPDGVNESGIGFMYKYSLWGFSVLSLPISFILIIVSHFFRIQKVKAILVSVGLFCFVCFGLFHYDEVIYGYFVAGIFYVLSVFLHWVIVTKLKKI